MTGVTGVFETSGTETPAEVNESVRNLRSARGLGALFAALLGTFFGAFFGCLLDLLDLLHGFLRGFLSGLLGGFLGCFFRHNNFSWK